ncbi:MAG: glycosyltransferase family 2 protein [Nannocystis sp.]|nr:glycosyltransferase family 2 protein [Nannocystis sp.]
MQPQHAAGEPNARSPEISVIVPIYNEIDSLPELYAQLTAGCRATARPYEILVINDGSTDGTDLDLDALAAADPQLHVIHFRRNFGKSPALAAGFERARGEIVLTLDGDLQDDPALIPAFIARIEAGADLVSGYKARRLDPLGKTLPSKLFNAVVRRISGIPLRDFNCGFKAYRAECVRELSVYGGFHRFLPVLAGERGFRIEELVVNHRPRAHGVSKYGLRRLIDGLLDLLTVLLVTRFRSRPLHFFSVPAVLLGAPGVAILTYLSVIWAQGDSIGTRPLLTLGVLLVTTAAHFLGLGLLGELLVRTTLRPSEIYSIRPPRPPRPPAPLADQAAADAPIAAP